MKSTLIVATTLLVTLTAGDFNRAGEKTWVLFDGCNWNFPKLCDEWRARKCWCPDDYCYKPLPNVPCVAKGCVDDYCIKPLPCVPPVAKGCVDDYCPKQCPIILWRCQDASFTCGPCQNTGKPQCGSSR